MRVRFGARLAVRLGAVSSYRLGLGVDTSTEVLLIDVLCTDPGARVAFLPDTCRRRRSSETNASGLADCHNNLLHLGSVSKFEALALPRPSGCDEGVRLGRVVLLLTRL